MLDHADHLEPFLLLRTRAPEDSLSDGALARPGMPGQIGIYDCDRKFLLVFLRREVAPREHPDAHRMEILGQYGMQRCRERLLSCLVQGVGFKYLRSRQRQRADTADCFHTRQHANFFERLPVKPPPALVRSEAPRLDVDLKREKMCGPETPVEPPECRERTADRRSA